VRVAAVDGFLVYSNATRDPRLLAALERGLPIVTVDQPVDVPTPWVGIDDRAAAREAVRHLIELGHERIGVVGFPEFPLDDESLRYDVTTERSAGYREELGDLWDPGLVALGRGNEVETGSRALEQLLAGDRPPTGVVAMSDALAAGVLSAAAARGIQVPSELSVVGFDDVPLAARTDPPLTTIAQPTEDKGRLAARKLLEAVEGDGLPAPEPTLLPTRLVVRGSTGPAPN
jgi:DNA-binding LacI/PurR family transcriptional regulator